MNKPLGTNKRLPTTTLNQFHNNPRRGNTTAIAESLKTNGQFRPLVVNAGTHTGRPNEVLAGNHTLLAALSLDGTEWALPELDCYVVDVDDEACSRIVLADNRTSDLGSYDDAALFDLLDTLQDDLGGTGYDDDDLADLSALLEEEDEDTSVFGGEALRRLGRGQTIKDSMLSDPTISSLYSTSHYPKLRQPYGIADYCDWEARMYTARPKLTPFGQLVLDELEATK